MATRTITVHDRCTAEGCGKVLLSIAEGIRGTCSSCWYKKVPEDTKRALGKLVASAFNGSTEEQRTVLLKDAMDKMKCDEQSGAS